MLAASALGGGWALAAAALFVSAATFVLGAVSLHRRARVDYVDELEHRIQECETDRKELRRELDKLKRENWELLRRLVRLEESDET